jgi:outer membrane protein TolC
MVNGGLVMSQNIYDGFATTNGVRSAKVKTEIERLVSQEIVNDTIKTAIIAYQDIILSRNRMQLREKQSDLMAATLKEVKVKHSKAIINSTDLAEAYAQESAIEAQYVAAESMLRKSEAQFMRIFNKVPPTALEEISEKLMNDSLPKSIEDCYDLMDKKNKQIEIHRLKLKDYNIMYRSAGSALLPSVNIEYKVEKMLQVSKFEEDYDVEGSVTGASLGVAVNIPLFHADKLAKRKALGKEILASEEEFGDKYSKMRERVLSAWHDYISVKKMMIYHVKNARAKEEAVNAMKIESEIGTKTMTDLMRARTDLFESQIKIMEGQKSLINSSVSLLDLIGGLDISIFAN